MSLVFSLFCIFLWNHLMVLCPRLKESVKKMYKIKISIEAERKTKIELKECVKETENDNDECYCGMYAFFEVND